MSVQFDPNASMVKWGNLLNKLSEADGADAVKFSEVDRSLIFTATVDGTDTQIAVRIPDDLDLPGEVDEAAIASLVEKLSDESLGLTDEQVQAFKKQITKLYKDMSTALSNVQSTSTGKVMFDLYKLMALLVEVGQVQRDSARELRTAQSAQIQNAIQSQADTQRAAAMVGLIVGVVCGAISAIVSGIMLGLQAASFKSQLNTARSSGTDAAQTNAQMTKGADNAAHANAQLQKTEAQVGPETATRVKNDVKAQVGEKEQAYAGAKNEAAEAQRTLDTAQRDFDTASADRTQKQTALRDAQRANQAARVEAEIPQGKTAARAKFEYVRQCAQDGTPANEQKLAKFDAAIKAENDMSAATTALAHAPSEQEIGNKQAAVTDARAALDAANQKVESTRLEYRAALQSAADTYTDRYNAAVANDGPNSDAAKAARNDMRMARAFTESKLNEEGVTTAVERRADVAAAEDAVDKASQRLNNNTDYKKALHRIERYSGINAVNTAIANMLQGMSQNISAMMNSEATRQGAEEKQEQEQLDQTKDLFTQAQSLIDSVIKLMQAVAAAESQSMRDAIQA